MIDPMQCRAARALLDWTQERLSQETGLSAVTIRAFERGGEMRDSNRNLLRLTLERSGVEFISENGGGAGVRLRERQALTEPPPGPKDDLSEHLTRVSDTAAKTASAPKANRRKPKG